MHEFGLVVLCLLLGACGARSEAPAPDPLDPFFRQEVGPPCAMNGDCATGLCDRLLIPRSGDDEAQGACSSIPYAIFPWQRKLLADNMVAVIGEDEGLRERVLAFAAGAMEAPDAPISIRLLALELVDGLLPMELDNAWERRLTALAGDWNLPMEQLLATMILAGRTGDGETLKDLEEIAARGTEAQQIRAARELASLCLPGTTETLTELATSRSSRFLRTAVAEEITRCPEPLRSRVLGAAVMEAMPYERAGLRRLESDAP
ncbi:MAG: hypothetical protein ABIK09_07225 [Pseudomonadota bacterium]